MELMKKHVDLDRLEVLYEMPFEQAALERDFDVRGGCWTLQDGTLIGANRENNPGMIISRQDFFGPVMLDFEARTILPCTHDINCMWSGSWDYETNTRALAYVAGLEGWWDGKVGFEKSPEYRLNCGTQMLNFEPGRYYHIQCGSFLSWWTVYLRWRSQILTRSTRINSARSALRHIAARFRSANSA